MWIFTKAGRWWHKHRNCQVEHAGPLGSQFGYYEKWECRTRDCYKRPKYLYRSTGYPWLPHWAT